jgi:hypothetical protein
MNCFVWYIAASVVHQGALENFLKFDSVLLLNVLARILCTHIHSSASHAIWQRYWHCLSKPTIQSVCIHVERNIEVRSGNHCYSGNAISVTYFVCVSVLLPTIYSVLCTRAVLFCHLWSVWLYHAFPYYLIYGKTFWKKTYNTKCMFWFPLQRMSETFLILLRTKRGIMINLYRPWCEVLYLFILLEFNQGYIFSTHFF